MTTVHDQLDRRAGSSLLGGVLRWRPGPKARAALHASAWSGGGFIAAQLLRMASNLILARTSLRAEDFALVQLVTVFVIGLEMVSDLGVGTNVVQHKRGEEPVFLKTAYTVQAVRGLSLWGLSILLAYPYALAFALPAVRMQLFWMVAVAGGAAMARGLSSSSVWTLTREVRPKGLAILSITGDTIGLVVAIIWAARAPSAWALVAQTLTSAIIYSAGSHLLTSRRDGFAWEKGVVRELMVFGAWMFLSSATWFLAGNGERLVFGESVKQSVITEAQYGCYFLAAQMTGAPTRGVMQIIAQVFFPMMAALRREDPVKAVQQYKRAKWLSCACGVAFSAGAILLGPLAVKILINKAEFEPVGWMVQLLGVRAGLDVLTGPSGSMLFAFGQSKYAAFGNILRIVIMGVGSVVTLRYWGLHAALCVLAAAPLGVYASNLVGLRRYMPSVIRNELLTLGVFALATAAAGALAVFVI